jgi:drug/metabolite transporter (DMT)-like permease
LEPDPAARPVQGETTVLVGEPAGVGRGIAWIVLATFLFVCLDVTAKSLMQTHPVNQVVWARFTFHLLLVLAFLGPRAPTLVRTRRPGLQLLRSVFMLAANGMFFLAVRSMPIVDASAIMFVGPLVVTALSVPLLGEQVGGRRWAAVAVGFAGALVIVQPGPGLFQSVAVLPLFGACAFGLYQITTRMLTHSDPALTTLLYTALVGTVVASASLPLGWVWPAAGGWILMVMAGAFGAVGQFALIRAVQAAPLSVVAPFNYLTLLWSAVLGYLVFGDLPATSTYFGAPIIVASGLYVLHRERVTARAG